MANNSIEPKQREAEKQSAFSLSLDGHSVNAIAKELQRDRGTISRYLSESRAEVATDAGSKEEMKADALAKIQHLYSIALKNLNDPNLRATSQTAPQWAKQALATLQTTMKLLGLEEPKQHEIRQHTVIEYVKEVIEAEEAQKAELVAAAGDDVDAVEAIMMEDPMWASLMPEKYVQIGLEHGFATPEGMHKAGLISEAEMHECRAAMTPEGFEAGGDMAAYRDA